MKNNIIIIILTTFIAAQGINSNINSYKTNVVLRPFEDKIEVITYVEIFNRNLQFLKKDIYFESSYDLNITLISEDGSKIEDKSFRESIEVDNFSKTVSLSNPKLIIAKFVIPFQEFDVNFTLKDMDTKLIGKKQKRFTKKNLPSGKYSKIFDPIFVKNKKGNWEFEPNKYPLNVKKIEVKNNTLEFYQYFSLKKGDYLMDVSLTSDKKTIWNKSIKDKSDKTYGYKFLQIPLDNIEKSDLRVKIQVSQQGNISSKSFPIELKNDYLMLSSIKDVSSALDQMNYILNIEERKELRNLKGSEKEKFFKKVWAKRDPDVTTKENELMIEYYKRVAFAEDNFSRGVSGGWKSDMGMIYILFGKPDDILKSMNPQQSYNYEKWYYFQINEEFSFIDEFGFGDYRLRTPFMY
tara:strand:- start:1041 stop:2261 length:1221 start_codon:yes stop_codon:yes gene_type:complete